MQVMKKSRVTRGCFLAGFLFMIVGSSLSALPTKRVVIHDINENQDDQPAPSIGAKNFKDQK